MTNPEDVERQIREQLESNGQLQKMRAMIVEAALQALHEQGEEKLFAPKKTLQAARDTEEGRLALGAVADCLAYFGLDYTANVLKLEAGLTDLPDGDRLRSALHVEGGEKNVLVDVVRRAAAGAAPPALAVPQALPVPVASSPKAAAPPVPSIPLAVPASPKVDDNADQPAGHEDSTYFISKWNKKSFLRKGQVTGQQVQIEYLNECTVAILDPLDSMTVDDCEGGVLFVAACEGSVFLRNCKNMTVHVACKQLRTRDCENVDLHIFTTTDPVVEMSHHMTFRPFHIRLPSLKQSFKDCKLDPTQNRFVHVYDFTTDAKELPTPHFTVLFPEHGVSMEDYYADQGTPECPPEIEDLVALRLMPAASSESGQNKSYDIKTGAALWAAGTASAQQKTDSDDDGDDSDKKEEEEKKDSSISDDFESESDVEEQAPAAPVVPSLGDNKPAAIPGGLDDQEYSSFDGSEDSSDPDDKYEVDEDEDDF
ncbi:Tubulin binding cofactor C, putative [Angomonas deanei]|uniref:Tubulin binding cofactor C, putative n=1 Tax=Angomonas deanei TaxID=59799 RepID=A0A7G2CTK1_9TRYP|nr:Tubulin binding cofactor C, putative [Angomonas deanei]